MTKNRRFVDRWTSGIEKHGYVSVPTLLIKHREELGLSIQETYVIIALDSYRWSNNKPWPSLETLGILVGLEPRSIRRYVESIEGKNLIKRTARPGTSNLYDFEGLIMQLNIIATRKPQPGQNWHKTSDKYVRPPRTMSSAKEDELEKDKLTRRSYNYMGNSDTSNIGSIIENRLKSKDFGKRGS